MRYYDVLIIGGGPCGIACAIHLRRGKLKVGIMERNRFGGLIRNARRIDNYPGFPGGISGERLSQMFLRHLEASGVDCIYDEAIGISESQEFEVIGSSDKYRARYLVIATGTKPKPSNIQFPALYYEVRDLKEELSRIAIIGGGDIAFDYALSCFERGMDVTLLIRSVPKAHPQLVEEVNETKGIKTISGVKDILHQESHIIVKTTHKEWRIEADAILVAIGREPEDALLEDARGSRNLFSAGSMRYPSWLRHTGISVGDGIRVACEILSREVRHGDCKEMG